jgi:hypothetical protein
MGLAFVFALRALAPTASVRLRILLGVGYGVAIWSCLMAILLVSQRAQSLMFAVMPLTVLFSLGGHLIYGLCSARPLRARRHNGGYHHWHSRTRRGAAPDRRCSRARLPPQDAGS